MTKFMINNRTDARRTGVNFLTVYDFRVLLARAHECVPIQNLRDLLQAKLDSKMSVRFLLKEHGDLYFLLHNFV